MTPFFNRDALCLMSKENAPARFMALRVSYLTPGSSAGLPEKLTGSPASVLTVMTLSSASLRASADALLLMAAKVQGETVNRYHGDLQCPVGLLAPSQAPERLGAMPSELAKQGC